MNSLAQIGAVAKQVSATAVLDGGDFFHLKAASRTSHALVAQAALVHSGYPCPVYAIEGNHDLAYNSLDSLDKQPLGVLFTTGVFQQLRDRVFISGGLKVRVVGLPYETTDPLERFEKIVRGDEDYLVVVAHMLASEVVSSKTDSFFREPVLSYGDLLYEGGPDVVLFGHWHRDQGVTWLDGRAFVNQGSVSRGALNMDSLDRVPQIAVLRFGSSVSIDLVPLEVAPAVDVFDLDRRIQADVERSAIEQFVGKLQEVTINVEGTEKVESYVASLDFAKDVRDTALNYLERARHP